MNFPLSLHEIPFIRHDKRHGISISTCGTGCTGATFTRLGSGGSDTTRWEAAIPRPPHNCNEGMGQHSIIYGISWESLEISWKFI